MMKASLGSAGTTGCLTNFRYIAFAHLNSWMENRASAANVAHLQTLYCWCWYLPAPARRSNHNSCSPARAFASHKMVASVLLLLRPPCGKHKGKYFLLGSSLIDPAHVHFLEPASIFSIPPSPRPVSEAAAGAPPLGSPLRKAPRRADETRPRPTPNSRCELYKRLPLSPDIHKKRFPLLSSSSEIPFFHLFLLL